MKGIILAGGKGTRLHPMTKGVCKQLLSVYDKPMIYYPLSVLMLAGIRDVLIIINPGDESKFKAFLGNGEELGMNICYKIQDAPNGIAEAFIVGEEFIGDDNNICLILGDNIFFGHGFPELLIKAMKQEEGATIFGYYVNDPERYGVVEFDKDRNVVSIEEKPKVPKSNYAVTGLYFYDKEVIDISKGLEKSGRGELEITDVNNEYLKRGELKVQRMARGHIWLDMGTIDSMLDASNYIATIERRQGLKVGCLEEIALNKGFITLEQYERNMKSRPDNSYREYLENMYEYYLNK